MLFACLRGLCSLLSGGFAVRPTVRLNWQVLALKELSIRGDIRTTTEYLVDLLESAEYASNTFSTRFVCIARGSRAAVARSLQCKRVVLPAEAFVTSYLVS